MLAGARVQPCREVLTAVAARLEEPADVGAMRLVSKAWNAAALDGTVTARLSKFATGALRIPSCRVKHGQYMNPYPSLTQIPEAGELLKGMDCHACASGCVVIL